MFYGYGIVNTNSPIFAKPIFGRGSNSTLNINIRSVHKGESNANDTLGNYNGTPEGGTTYVAGKSGDTFNFNGTSGDVILPNASWNMTGDFTISMWVNYGRVVNSQILAATFRIGGLNGISGWYIESTANQLRFAGFGLGGGSAFSITKTSYTPATSTWIHYTFVHENYNNRMYENGVLIASDTTNFRHCLYDSTNYPMIGANKYDASTYQEFFQGKIDEVYTWDRALTGAEVTELQTKYYPF